MKLRQEVATGIVWSGLQMWGGRAISLAVFVILSRLLNPESFGLVAMASLFVVFVQIFQDQGFGDAIVQRSHLDPEHLDTAFWTNLLTGGLLAAGGLAGSGLVAELFHEPRLVPIVRWLSLTFVLAGLTGTQQALLRRQLAFKQLALRSLVAAVAGGIVGLGMAYAGFGVWSLVSQDLATAIIGVVVLWRVSDWRPGFRFSLAHFRELFAFGVNIIGINLLNFLNTHFDDLLIGYFLGPTLLGVYTVAYRLLVNMIELLTGVTNAVFFPAFSRIQHDPERTRRALYRITQYTSLISFPLFIGAAVVAPELVGVVFGPQWALSIPVMQVLAFIGILHSIFYFNNSVVIAAGKPAWRLAMSLTNAVSNVLAFTLAVHWGIVAVAAAYVIRGYLVSPVEVWMIHKLIHIDLKTYLGQYLAPAIGSLSMAVTVIALRYFLGPLLNLPVQLVIYVLSGGLAYLAVVQWVVPSFWRQLTDLTLLVLPGWARLNPFSARTRK